MTAESEKPKGNFCVARLARRPALWGANVENKGTKDPDDDPDQYTEKKTKNIPFMACASITVNTFI